MSGEPERSARSHRGRILVVDDEADVRAGVAVRLRSIGYEVTEAAGGEEALRRIREDSDGPEVVILDVAMPGMDGLRVLEEIRRLDFPPYVVLLTAHGTRTRRLHALQAGAHEFLEKPYDAEELAARIEVALRERALIATAREEAREDPLTGLPNLRVFEETLQAEFDRARRYRRSLALVYLDADGLKRVNDARGHSAGDALLRRIADALRRTCRTVDVPARIGGDEFAAILPEADAAGAEGFLDRFRRALVEPAVLGVPSPTSASAGFSVFAPDDDGARRIDDLRRAADEALYRAKRARAAGR